MELIDSHVHLDAKEFDLDRSDVIKRAIDRGVAKFITIGASDGLDSAIRAIELAKQHDFIWCSVGLHPHDAKLGLDLPKLRELAKYEKVVAIGETGLDFFRDWSPKADQKQAFVSQVELACEMQLPLIIHSREAGESCIEVLKELGAAAVGGVFHCYSEDAAFAARLAEINFMVSFPGSVTFKKATTLKDVVRDIPLKQMMVETDAPYLAPEPFRGKRCESSYLVETVKEIAKIKGISYDECGSALTANTRSFFKI